VTLLNRIAGTREEATQMITFENDGSAEDRLRRATAGQFKEGVKRACSRPIWARIREAMQEAAGCENVSDEHIANYFGLARSDVNKGRNDGRLSLETLFVLMTVLRWEFKQLPALPDAKYRCLEGYRLALRLIDIEVYGKERPEDICLSELVATVATLREVFDRMYSPCSDDELVIRARKRAAHILGLSDGSAELTVLRTWEDCVRLRSKWGKLVSIVRDFLHPSWTESVDPRT